MIDTLDPETTAVGWQDPGDPEAEAAADATARRNDPIEWLKQHPVFHPSNQRAVPIIGMRKLGRKRGQYEMILRGYPNVELGTAEDVLQARRVQSAIADTTGIVIDELKRPRWREVAAGIFAAAGPGEDIGTDPETEAKNWLAAMMNYHVPRGGASSVDLADTRALHTRIMGVKLARDPFDTDAWSHGWFLTTEREVCVHIPTLVRFVNSPLFGGRTTQADARLRLRRLGFRPAQLSARGGDDGEPVKARLWISPKGFDVDE